MHRIGVNAFLYQENVIKGDIVFAENVQKSAQKWHT
jgi:hypothetical protein